MGIWGSDPVQFRVWLLEDRRRNRCPLGRPTIAMNVAVTPPDKRMWVLVVQTPLPVETH